MRKLDELKEAVNDRCVFGWRDVKRLIERVEELEREKLDLEGIILGLKDVKLGKVKPLDDITKLQRYRELAEKIDWSFNQIGEYDMDMGLIDGDKIHAMARELLKED